MNRWNKYVLEIVVFICGAVVMIFELVGSRIIGPYVGTSTYAWTSLIGVILASLSIGYYIGGYLADKLPSVRPMALIILISSLAIALSILLKDIFSIAISSIPISVEVQSLLISFVLFAPASFLLGMVSPYAVRLRINDVTTAGKTAGNLYALSTAGSIFGTFMSGFYIIPNVGSTNSLVLLSGTLLVTAVVLFSGNINRHIIGVIFLCSVSFIGATYAVASMQQGFLVADIDTEYNRIWIYRSIDSVTKKPIVVLATDPYGTQAAMFTDGTDDLVLGYTQFFRLYRYFVPHPKSALMIGGSAYTYPRDFIKQNPTATLDVVEIDPGMTEVAKRYFGLKDEKNLSIHHQDARIFLNETHNTYDVIFGDAFNSASSVPFQLTTQEAAEKEYDALHEGGIIMVNIISAIEGEKGKFARAEYATYKKVFPQVYLFAVQDNNDGTKTQNVMLVALKSDVVPQWVSSDKEVGEYLSHLWVKPIMDDVPVLTDDFAPVEYYKRVSL